jgi:hypothetical protein
MNTLLDLATRMEKLKAGLPTRASELAKQVAGAIEKDLTEVTPADVGDAISNWQVSLNEPAVGTIGAFSPSPRGRMRDGKWTHAVDPAITRSNNAPAAQAAAQATIQSKQPGQPIFITNSLPYIKKLDSGSSDQAPAGFFDRAIIVGKVALDKAKSLL